MHRGKKCQKIAGSTLNGKLKAFQCVFVTENDGTDGNLLEAFSNHKRRL